jgi:hemerythrin-like domain-containing protein
MATGKSLIDFRTPAAGFDQPLALWEACHERVQRMVGLLERLLEHLRVHGADESARVTATSIRRYFDEAAPRHHEDEEIDLFPRLQAKVSGAPAERIHQAIATLRADHEELHGIWTQLRLALQAVERGEPATFDEAAVAIFVTRYRTHIELEESVLAPALARVLGKRELAKIGRAMAARRGVKWEEISARG